ncbi:UDP-N-acetylmuramate--L-alanine ligase [Campylobacter hyointestinalis]|uniref:UDP-N-acetylmuramate--L-alanine ligase n=1 Tax=Campylobacter hyointestinalis TaxID=198 RepID=UPI000DCD5AB9|nr:UDP-N-acetylmuramate--L-alanine ligase [Campylobacter hyointestinalis]RAZ61491.1 UDP-N-acetylmuramate--L-alanine ligase [Campylobacter hyointestinalis subsp. lawsonii]
MKKVHFIGIGGIGISAIARFLKEKDFIISGSDIKESNTTKELRQSGMKITVPHCISAIEDPDFVVYSAAIKSDNVELIEARKKGIKCLSRKEALPFILEGKRVFAVAGAHGKSTTSAMLCTLLDGSVIIGAISKQFGSNMKYEQSENVIFEADESDSSFLNSNPYLAVVTNAEPEHMEHYDFDIDKFHSAYKGFLERAKIRVINADDEFLNSLKMDCIKLYKSDITDLKMVLRNYEPYTSFNLKGLGKFEAFGMGEHIAIDASLAILAANSEVGLETIRVNLKKFKGIKKRFDILVANEKFALIDDYGHHPTEIKATLKSAKEYAKLLGLEKITAIFQPHRYTRLKANLDGFKECFKDVDELVVLPVYSAGEEPNDIVLKDEFENAVFADFVKRDGETIEFFDSFGVKHKLSSGLVIGFGAGDITYQLRGA